MTEEEIFEGRVRDLISRTWQRDILTHTGFLTLAEQARISDIRGGRKKLKNDSLPPVTAHFAGGYPDAERRMAVFLPSYPADEEEESLITALKILPRMKAYSEDLTHRDYLGALMNLGIERELIGDIVADREAHEAVVYVESHIAAMICGELLRVRHTDVNVRELLPGEEVSGPETAAVEGSVASERIDCILAFVYRLSRTKSQDLIKAEAVSADGHLMTEPGRELKEGMRVSVRGFGKFIYRGAVRKTKKDRMIVRCDVFQ